MKRLSIALIALGLSTSVFADSIVLVPSQKGGLKVGMDVLYLRPHNSDLGYATLLTPVPGVSVNSEHNATIDPNYDWGFYAQIGYLFPSTGNDLTLGYTRFHTDSTNSIDMPPDDEGNLFITVLPMATLFEPVGGGDLAFFEHAFGKAKFDLDTVDLEAGQRFATGAFDMRMFAGIRYTWLDHTLQVNNNSNINIVEDVFTSFGNQAFTSNFKGLGPRVGIDGRYCLSSGFGLDANLSVSLLVGNLTRGYQANGQVVSDAGLSDQSTINAHFKSANSSATRVVPNIDAKLGVDYTHPIDFGRNKAALVFEAGYQVTSYFNAVDHSNIVVSTGNAFAYQSTTTNMLFDGIYFGVKYYA